MTFSTRSSGRPAGLPLALLVLAVLAGVLGMHALAPGGVPAAQTTAGHERVTAAADGVPHADGAYEPARRTAGQIITSRSAEIEQMDKLLGED
ncbi:hypothetical protein GL259_05750 [Streptomyces sp. Tu 3180]|uniref:DUF6153 family protein n=1 Tax=Streptomyces sp. enrichment culture TaxID=1795815 RepID=UPI00135CA151|nr:hypothetical protein GL259_05750 [Streptomyces sp. Tu 3180]